MAEGLFKKIIADRNMTGIECRSCGVYAFPGDEATPEAIAAAKELGADISAHRSSPLNQYIIDSTDIFICMTASHAASLKFFAPKSDSDNCIRCTGPEKTDIENENRWNSCNRNTKRNKREWIKRKKHY